MADGSAVSSLVLPLPYGPHQLPWNLQILLHKGGAAMRRVDAQRTLDSGGFGKIEAGRRPLIEKAHAALTTKAARGGSPQSIRHQLEAFWRFVSWADKAHASLAMRDIKSTFTEWTETLIHRVTVLKDLSHRSAYTMASVVADLIARSLELQSANPGASLLRHTRMRVPRSKKRSLGAQADKQNLGDTFAFGHFLADICDGLAAAVVRGPVPVTIPTSTGETVTVLGGVRSDAASPERIRNPSNRRRALKARAALPEGISVLDQTSRSRLLNLRIEAELLIFIAQTGMNLAQAKEIRRDAYRWKADGEDLLAFRVYKARREGEAIFRCFKAYRSHLRVYLQWLAALGFAATDDRLFPFVYPVRIPAAHSAPEFITTRRLSALVGLSFFGPRSLRKTRLNWLLRRSRDLEVTAEQSGHTKQTLLRVYAQPHHQTAAMEIARFHVATDPSVASPGPGRCVAGLRGPEPFVANSMSMPQPDCISPEGCLFCVHHRDVLSKDYCWKLASHSKLKALELTLFKPSVLEVEHPVMRVLERLRLKLDAIADGSEVRRQWVKEAEDSVRAGRYHAEWDEHIHLLELIA